MNSLTDFGIAFVLIAVVMIFFVPRRWAPVPLLVGACYMVLSQGMQIGPFHFYSIRILLAAGIGRVILRSERPANGLNGLDWLMLVWSSWSLVSSLFHADPADAIVFNLGLVFNACGVYFLLRTFLQSLDDVLRICRVATILLVPVAVEMLLEKMTAHNIFSMLGGVSDIPNIREGKIRAQGPFAHAILAGTVGAVCLPLAIGLWRQYRKTAVVGMLACLTMVVACSSSGPVMSSLFAVGAMLMWPFRHRMRLFRWLAFLGYIALNLVMQVPAYYLLARIDISGGSTGYHRARLIESALEHLDEWWLGGTDYTRHWMATGVSWSQNHTDITNHYLQMGVLGGMPLMLLFIAILVKGFSFVGQIMQQRSDMSQEMQFFFWGLGASLFAHAATCISVSYFDQSFLFLYLTIAAIAVAHGASEHARSYSSVNAQRRTRHGYQHSIPVRP